MKKIYGRFIVLLMTVTMLLTCSSNSFAVSFVMGDYKFNFDGVSHFDQNSTDLWGIANITSIFRDANNDGLHEQNYWSSGINGEYLSLKFGGMDADHMTSTPGTSGNQIYFQDDSENGPTYVEMWLNTTDAYSADIALGAGTGAYNTFGTTVDNGILALDMQFAAGALWLEESTYVAWGVPNAALNANLNDQYRTTQSTSTTNATLAYLDVIGGIWQNTFDSNGFYNNSPLINTARQVVSGGEGFDIRMEGSNSLILPTNQNNSNLILKGWNTNLESTSATASAVPEPNTILLLGFGLLGLAGITRRKTN